jgi:hypothetical protein
VTDAPTLQACPRVCCSPRVGCLYPAHSLPVFRDPKLEFTLYTHADRKHLGVSQEGWYRHESPDQPLGQRGAVKADSVPGSDLTDSGQEWGYGKSMSTTKG